MSSLSLSSTDGGYLVKLVPPQTVDAGVTTGKGAYLFVIDVSGRCARDAASARAADGRAGRADQAEGAAPRVRARRASDPPCLPAALTPPRPAAPPPLSLSQHERGRADHDGRRR